MLAVAFNIILDMFHLKIKPHNTPLSLFYHFLHSVLCVCMHLLAHLAPVQHLIMSEEEEELTLLHAVTACSYTPEQQRLHTQCIYW